MEKKKSFVKEVVICVIGIMSICCLAIGANGSNLSDLISNSTDASAKTCWYNPDKNNCSGSYTIGCAPCPSGGSGGDEEEAF
jgi:hypothetical protein